MSLALLADEPARIHAVRRWLKRPAAEVFCSFPRTQGSACASSIEVMVEVLGTEAERTDEQLGVTVRR